MHIKFFIIIYFSGKSRGAGQGPAQIFLGRFAAGKLNTVTRPKDFLRSLPVS
jgi:hypothetical protein